MTFTGINNQVHQAFYSKKGCS